MRVSAKYLEELMTFDATTTVREIAATMPQATRVFEKLKIDYCCGGSTPLLEACTNAGVDFEELQNLLGHVAAAPATAPAIDFQHATLPQLIEHIVEKH